jgi:hypothetical protein
MKKITMFLSVLFWINVSFGQLSGTYTIPGNPYPTIASAIAALNAQGVGAGGVTFNVLAGHVEIFGFHADGLINIITNPSNVSNPVIFQKYGSGLNPKIISATGLGFYDFIICIAGSDYVTFDGIDLQENPSNTTVITQSEWGYAIFKNSSNDGTQNCTIKNCNITLNKQNTATWGIYSNNMIYYFPVVQLTITAESGENSGNKFYGNSITNSYNGICVSGYADAAFPYLYYDQNNDIGSAAGNTFSNFAGGPETGYMVYAQYQNGLTIANCDISGGAETTGALYGIYGGTATNANINIYGNTITLNSASTTSYIMGIYNSGLGTTGTSNTLNIYNNIVRNCTAPNATSAYFYGIYSAARAFNLNLYDNTVTGNVIAGSSYVYLCYTQSGTGGTGNVYNNTITNNQRSGNGTQSTTAYLYCLYCGGSTSYSIHDNTISGNSAPAQVSSGAYIYSLYCSNSAASQSIFNNSIHDQTITSSSPSTHAIYGIYSYPPSTSTGSIYNNQVYNLTINTSSTGYGYIFGCYICNASSIYSNTLHDIAINTSYNGYGYMYGLYSYNSHSVYSNDVYNLSTSNSGTGYGYGYGYYINSSGTSNIYRNRLWNVTMAGTSGYFYGLYTSSGTPAIFNNYISDLKAPASTRSTAISGVYISGGINVSLCYNTIYLNATSTSANDFGTNGIYASTTPVVELRNNIIVNTSTAPASTTYKTVAFRNSSAVSGVPSYALTSGNNDFYAGIPGSTNLIYSDGVNDILTICAYKAYMAPRDAQSFTEMPPFENITLPPYDLHINANVPTRIESGGSIVSTPLSITTDFDSDSRFPNAGYPGNSFYNATAPDVGADEFGGLNSPLTLSVQGFVTNVACFGGSSGAIAVNASGGTAPYSYHWNNNAATPDIASLNSSTYTVTVTDACLSIATGSWTVTQPDIPLSIQVTRSDVICYGVHNGSATAEVTGGTAGYLYAWNNGQVTNPAVNLGPGTYTVTVNDSHGCEITGSTTITQPLPLYINAGANQMVYYGYRQANCTTLSWSGVSGGTAPYTIWWSTGQTSQTITVCPVVTTVYTVTIKDANNCTFSDQVKVCVSDIRCGNDNNPGKKVWICHNTGSSSNPRISLCVDTSAVQAHLLQHGDVLGRCDLDRICSDLKSILSDSEGNDQILNDGDIILDAFPNPFSESATITFTCPDEGQVTVKLIDYTGKEVALLFNKNADKKVHYMVIVDGRGLSPGLYVCILQHSDGTMKIKKLLYTR